MCEKETNPIQAFPRCRERPATLAARLASESRRVKSPSEVAPEHWAERENLWLLITVLGSNQPITPFYALFYCV